VLTTPIGYVEREAGRLPLVGMGVRGGDRCQDGKAECFAETFDRLRQVKAKYDPDDMFRAKPPGTRDRLTVSWRRGMVLVVARTEVDDSLRLAC